MRLLLSLAICCCLSWEMNAQCNATITPLGPTTFCQGGSVTLEASNGYVHKWYLNGNLVAVLVTNTLTVTMGGSYQVVTQSTGCIDTSAALVVTVNTTPPQSTITAIGTTTICQGNHVTLVSSFADTYQWYLNGSAIAGANNDTFLATMAGSYTVEVDSAGCADTSNTQMVTVNSIPAQPGGISCADSFCAGLSYTFSIAPVPGALSYTWMTPDPHSSTGSTFTVSVNCNNYTAPTNIISVRAENTCGSSQWSNKQVAIFAPPILGGMNNDPDFAYNYPTPICPYFSFTLNAFTHGGSCYAGPRTYQWYKNNIPLIGETGYHLGANSGGNYKVVIYTGNGVCATTLQKNPIYQCLPTPAIQAVNSTSLCSGGATELKVNFTNDNYIGTYYYWYWELNGTPIPGSLKKPYWMATLPGNYSINMVGTDTIFDQLEFCGSTPFLTVVQSGNTASAISIAQNGNDFIATPGFASYQWYKNNDLIAGAVSGTYAKTTWGDYFVVGTDGNGCKSMSNVILAVDDLRSEEKDISLYPNPNTGVFALSAHIDGKAIVMVTDVSSRVVLMQEVVAKNGVIYQEIKLEEDVTPGIYFLKLTSENYNKVISFVKQ